MNRALLVIDVQESFRQLPMWRLRSNPDITDRVGTLAEAARAAGDLVVWVLHNEPRTGSVFDPALGHVRLMAEMQPREGEPVLHKTAHNAFTTTNLQQLLTAGGVGELVICGIRTEQCCETTARVGSDAGYRIDFVTEATSTDPIAHRDAPATDDPEAVLADPRTLHPAEITTRTEYALAGRFARIRTIAELTGSRVA